MNARDAAGQLRELQAKDPKVKEFLVEVAQLMDRGCEVVLAETGTQDLFAEIARRTSGAVLAFETPEGRGEKVTVMRAGSKAIAIGLAEAARVFFVTRLAKSGTERERPM